MRQNLVSLIEKKQLTKAGVGNEKKLLFDESIRSDSIYWLDRKHDNEFENDFLDQEIRQIIYGKGRNIYRILFTILDDTVQIVFVRHAAQKPIIDEFDEDE